MYVDLRIACHRRSVWQDNEDLTHRFVGVIRGTRAVGQLSLTPSDGGAVLHSVVRGYFLCVPWELDEQKNICM